MGTLMLMDAVLLLVQGAAQEALEKYSQTLSVEYNTRVCKKLVRHLKGLGHTQRTYVHP